MGENAHSWKGGSWNEVYRVWSQVGCSEQFTSLLGALIFSSTKWSEGHYEGFRGLL